MCALMPFGLEKRGRRRDLTSFRTTRLPERAKINIPRAAASCLWPGSDCAKVSHCSSGRIVRIHYEAIIRNLMLPEDDVIAGTPAHWFMDDEPKSGDLLIPATPHAALSLFAMHGQQSRSEHGKAANDLPMLIVWGRGASRLWVNRRMLM